jgi:hypothetical protein
MIRIFCYLLTSWKRFFVSWVLTGAVEPNLFHGGPIDPDSKWAHVDEAEAFVAIILQAAADLKLKRVCIGHYAT